MMASSSDERLESDVARVIAAVVLGRGNVQFVQRRWRFTGFGTTKAVESKLLDVDEVAEILFASGANSAALAPITDSLHVVRLVLSNRSMEPAVARWRCAARIVEAAAPYAERTDDPVEREFLPVFRWLRWRILSEPFRNDTFSDGWWKQTLSDERALRRSAAAAREAWAEMLLSLDDVPILRRLEICIEGEGRLLVFKDHEGSRSLSVQAPRVVPDRADDSFITWFSREFFARRFMIDDVWRTVHSRWKWAAALSLAVASAAAIAGGLWWSGSPPGWLLLGGGVALVGAVGVVAVGLVVSDDGERFAYPFLLRFAAGTIIGSAALVTMRGAWIAQLNDPPQALWWAPYFTVFGLLIVGLVYLVVESRIHGVGKFAAVKRAGVVWLIGLGWAVNIAAIDIVVIAPLFTEEFPDPLVGVPRVWAFIVVALAALDLGILLQVLWEDRPVTYPLGALRLSRRR